MPDAAPKIRLFVAARLGPGADAELAAEQAHYLRNVMRCRAGDEVALFNAGDGEWRGRIESLGKGACRLRLTDRLRPARAEPGPWLVFAAVKRGPLDLMAEKACELGVAVLQPLITKRTVVERINLARLTTIATGAAEQCGRLSVPEVRAPVELGRLIAQWPPERPLIFCDEGGEAPPLASMATRVEAPACAVLVGPEGGFDEAERTLLRRQAFVRPVRLGPRLLRAETAGIAALAALQALAGDWRA